MPSELYNPDKPDSEAAVDQKRDLGPDYAKKSVSQSGVAVSSGRSPRHSQSYLRRRATREQVTEALELGRFIAAECGARMVPDSTLIPEGAVGWFDEKSREYSTTLAVQGGYGVVPFREAQRESEKFLEELARRPDIDPDGPDVLVAGETLTALKASWLQGLARAYKRVKGEH